MSFFKIKGGIFIEIIIKKENNYEFLKIMVLIFMLIDHIGSLLLPDYLFLRMLGRIVLPLVMFQYLISFQKTSNRKKSLKLVWIFALISQIPFTLYQNIDNFDINNLIFSGSIFLSLAISYTILYILYETKLKIIVRIIITLILLILSFVIPMDYNGFIPITILLMYLVKDNHYLKSMIFFFVTIIFILLNLLSYLQIIAVLIFIIAPLIYKIKLPFIFNKYIHYWYYPIHLSILCIIYYIIYLL